MDLQKPIFLSAVVLTILLVSTGGTQTYDFNSGTTEGWSLDQMYETSTQNKITPFTSFSLSNLNNQLAASVSPLLIGDPSIQSYDIYLESPDLSSNANWQNIAGYSIDLQRTLDSPCGHPPNVYFAQLQLKVIDTSDNNKVKLFAEYSGSNFVFHDIVFGQNYHFVWKPSFLTDPKYKVKNIRIRLTGPGDPGPGGGECAPEGSWLLDNVNAEGSISTASITVDVPNGGEVWEANTPHFIVWHSQNFTDPVKIEYSTDGGGSYSTIVANTSNDGSHEWTVPNAPSTQCLVRISDAATGNPSDVSDANFTITANEAIFVDVPNGGESWEAGTPHYIVWHTHLFGDPVKIEYSTDGGGSYTTLTASTANSGSYQWNVPNTPSTLCRVRISDASDGNPSDVSDSDFTITATESITLDVPNGGENWQVGSPHYIVWHNHLFSDPVKIEYSTDGGSSYSTIAPSALNSGTYQWSIPNTPSSNCLVRISDASDGNPADESDASFTISSTAQTNTPPGSNIQVPLGSGVEVTFDNVINGGTTTLEVKTNGTAPPGGLAIVPPTDPKFYDITTTADFTTNVEVCIEYDPANLSAEQLAELTLQVYEEPPGQWANITTAHDVGVHIICGSVDHLSEFAVMAPGSAPTITVISPNGNEIWPVGSQQEIQWTSTDFTDPVRIEYSIDGNATHLDVINSTENDGSYLWTVPNTPSTQCVVIISDPADGQPFDISDAVFTISGTTSEGLLVENTNDTGSGSLRNAIEQANVNPGPDNILFAIPQSDPGFNDNDGTWTIQPQTALPAITDSGLVIDGFTQTEFIGSDLNPDGPEIVINGGAGENLYQGLMIQSSHNVIKALVVNGFRTAYAILIQGEPARENTVIGCYLGTNASGTDSIPNLHGLSIYNAPDNLIGDVNAEDRNIVSGNLGYGLSISGETATGNRIFGNYIGLDKSGSKAVSNGELGISLSAKNNFIGGFLPGERNVISGNRIGMRIGDDNNFVFGNYIGTNAAGTDTIGNKLEGLGIWGGENNQIGGDEPEAGNLICGNQTGILIHSNNNHIVGNYIGSDINYTQNLGNIFAGIHFSAGAKNNIIGPKNIIAYNGYNGVTVYADSTKQNTITQNSITANSNLGIEHRFGGNDDLSAPSNMIVSEGVVSGTAPPNSTVELFSDDADEGKIYEGTTTADANGNFQWNGTPVGPYVTATATDAEGNTSQFSPAQDVTFVADSETSIPQQFNLSQNYPNPFNPTTTIEYELPQTSHITIRIYNLSGQEVQTLVDAVKQPGVHRIEWDGRNSHGATVGSGLYVVRMVTSGFVQCRRIVLLR